MSKEALKFLDVVWEKNFRDGDTFFLSRKTQSGDWSDVPFTMGKTTRKDVGKYITQNSDSNLYFCPVPFKGKHRQKPQAKPSKLLFADIDEHAYPSLIEPYPSMLWESSPGRYQGIWFLDKEVNPGALEETNKALSYAIGADPSGWDLVQVLRIPGTKNYKEAYSHHKKTPRVKIVNGSDDTYPYAQLSRLTNDLKATKTTEKVSGPHDLDVRAIIKKRKVGKAMVKLLYHTTAEIGKRSEVLWRIENDLWESGLTPSEIIKLVRVSPWNKYKGRHDEDDRLRADLIKIIGDITEEEEDPDINLDSGLIFKVEDYQSLMAGEHKSQGWLVPGFWLDRSYGIIAGEPKSFKSTLAIDLAISVSSGSMFLGEIEVTKPGPVIYIQNENSPWIIKDRIEKMITHKGLVGSVKSKKHNKLNISFAPTLPLYFVNQQGVMVDDDDHRENIERFVEEIRPKLLFLDPLYLMFGGDMNSAKDLNDTLRWLLYLKEKYDCGVVLIHHNKKTQDEMRGGQKMLGSTTLHGWVESAWYLRSGFTPGLVTMEREFRASGGQGLIDIKIDMGDIGEPRYNVEVTNHMDKANRENEELSTQIIGILENEGTTSKKRISEVVGKSARKVKVVLDIMEESGKIEVGPKGVYLL